MPQNKTTETTASVTEFIDAIAHEVKRRDSHTLVQVMTAQTGLEAKMWGTAIIGFGSYHYQYASGHKGDAPLMGFSPRANAISLYVVTAFEQQDALLQKLGKYKMSKACIYIKKLSDIDMEVLKELITRSVAYLQQQYPNKD